MPISASFGIASTIASGYDLRLLLAHADSALYAAKRAGRNRVAVYDTNVSVIGSTGSHPAADSNHAQDLADAQVLGVAGS